jgi:hypothetical protein
MPKARTNAQGRGSHSAGDGQRTVMVWSALGVSMLGVAALLALMSGGGTRSARAGMALSPLVQLSRPGTLEPVFATRAPMQDGRWAAIVIHDSGSPVGGSADLDQQARAEGLDGLGYHFVVGNGVGMDNGAIHVGYRWLEQLPGAHVAGARAEGINRVSIGVCLVGDGSRQAFTEAQLSSLAQLVAALADRCSIPTESIVLHSDLSEVTSPGRFFPRDAFLEQVRALRR